MRSLVFSPNGKMLASGGKDRTIILWDVARQKFLGHPLTGQPSFVQSVAFSPDGKVLASGDENGALILWDVAGQESLGSLTEYNDTVRSLVFSPDGKTLTAGSSNDAIILWDISLESWRTRACRIANRNLTRAEWAKYIGDIEPYRATCPELPIEAKEAKSISPGYE